MRQRQHEAKYSAAFGAIVGPNLAAMQFHDEFADG
jgi:imidazoleglycerol phosphate synthase glutamine amidotransferase subunit HisH